MKCGFLRFGINEKWASNPRRPANVTGNRAEFHGWHTGCCRIAQGYIADLVLFDPAVVIDQSTIDAPEAPPLGIPAVMVSGEWVIDNAVPTGNHPGRVLRSSAYRPRSLP